MSSTQVTKLLQQENQTNNGGLSLAMPCQDTKHNKTQYKAKPKAQQNNKTQNTTKQNKKTQSQKKSTNQFNTMQNTAKRRTQQITKHKQWLKLCQVKVEVEVVKLRYDKLKIS